MQFFRRRREESRDPESTKRRRSGRTYEVELNLAEERSSVQSKWYRSKWALEVNKPTGIMTSAVKEKGNFRRSQDSKPSSSDYASDVIPLAIPLAISLAMPLLTNCDFRM